MADVLTNIKNWLFNTIASFVPKRFRGNLASKSKTKEPGEGDGSHTPKGTSDAQKRFEMHQKSLQPEEKSIWDSIFGSKTSGEGADISEFSHENLYPAPKPISTKPKWNDVFISPAVSDKNMKGTLWDRFGGWDNITNGILNVWNSAGFNKPPVFTSGKRTVEQNKAVGGVKDSKHLTGEAFDLRNRDIPIKDRNDVYASLLAAFGGKVSSSKSQRHEELDGTKKQHFHFRAAAEGYFGKVTDPTLFLTGESGPENVIIQPARDPSQQTNFMRNMGADMSFGMGGLGGGGITTVVDASSSNSNATVLAVGNGPHPAPIDDGLHWYSPHR